MFDGPECQQTKRSFGGRGYAWFPPIRPCFQSHISLDFLAESADGLLLYDGPLGPAYPGEPEDFIAIGRSTTGVGGRGLCQLFPDWEPARVAQSSTGFLLAHQH